MNSFSPLTSKPSPAGVAVVLSAVRSEPAPGSVRAKPEMRSPRARMGSSRPRCSALPKVRSGSTAPMQPCTEDSAATVGSINPMRVTNGAKRAKGAPWPPYFGSISMPQ